MAVDLLAAPVHVVDRVGDKHARCGTEVRGRGPYCWARYVAVLKPRAWCEQCVIPDADREGTCPNCRQPDVIGERGICATCLRDRRGD